MKDSIRVVCRKNQLFLITNRRVYKHISKSEVDNYKNPIYFLGIGYAVEY